MSASNELLTIDEVAESFRVSRKTVSNWIRTKKLKAYKFSGTVRIPRKEADKLLTQA